jgi:hypothetical protein
MNQLQHCFLIKVQSSVKSAQKSLFSDFYTANTLKNNVNNLLQDGYITKTCIHTTENSNKHSKYDFFYYYIGSELSNSK